MNFWGLWLVSQFHSCVILTWNLSKFDCTNRYDSVYGKKWRKKWSALCYVWIERHKKLERRNKSSSKYIRKYWLKSIVSSIYSYWCQSKCRRSKEPTNRPEWYIKANNGLHVSGFSLPMWARLYMSFTSAFIDKFEPEQYQQHTLSWILISYDNRIANGKCDCKPSLKFNRVFFSVSQQWNLCRQLGNIDYK